MFDLDGVSSTLTYTLIAYPSSFRVSSSRMMSHPYPLPYPSPPIPPSTVVTRPSFRSVALQIHARDGFAGFFRGLGPCIVRAFPVNACALFVYEGIMMRLGAEKVSSIQISMSHIGWY